MDESKGTISEADLEVAAKAAAASEFDRDWKGYRRAISAAFKALGFEVADYAD